MNEVESFCKMCYNIYNVTKILWGDACNANIVE